MSPSRRDKKNGWMSFSDKLYQTNELNQYTQRTVPGAIDVFGLAEQGVTVLVNGTEADQWEGPPLAGPQKSYFHKVVSVDNSASARHLTLII